MSGMRAGFQVPAFLPFIERNFVRWSFEGISYCIDRFSTQTIIPLLIFRLWFTVKIFLKLRKFQPQYSYEIYSYSKGKVCSDSYNVLLPRSCLLAVFAMFLAIISPSSSCSSYSWNEWSVRHFYFHNQNNSTSSPGLLGNGALTCSGLHFLRHFVKHNILRNLVISNWLWWVMRVLLANQNWRSILNE